jgi:hypothetical protein
VVDHIVKWVPVHVAVIFNVRPHETDQTIVPGDVEKKGSLNTPIVLIRQHKLVLEEKL